jgi:hypothetical protein
LANTLPVLAGGFILAERVLDELPRASRCGARRLAGVDLQKERMRIVSQAVIALAPKPEGFSARELAERVRLLQPGAYSARQAAYDLSKRRGKALVERIERTRRYRPRLAGISTLAGLLILREKVIRPVLAGLARRSPLPKNLAPIDQHYENLQREMRRTLQTLALAA